MTVRQVFYQLVARGAIEKTEAQYQQTVIRLMTEMRLDGELRWDWVIDESRRSRVTQTFDSIEDALADTAKFYRRSALKQSDDYVEIWLEKDALAGSLWDVTSDYDVPLMVSRGIPSLTFLHGTAQHIRQAASWGKLTYVYQFGDWDPSGVLIPKSIERRLNELCKRLDCPAPIVERVALTKKQGESVELDALPPRVLRDMVREVISNQSKSFPGMTMRPSGGAVGVKRPGGVYSLVLTAGRTRGTPAAAWLMSAFAAAAIASDAGARGAAGNWGVGGLRGSEEELSEGAAGPVLFFFPCFPGFLSLACSFSNPENPDSSVLSLSILSTISICVPVVRQPCP